MVFNNEFNFEKKAHEDLIRFRGFKFMNCFVILNQA